MNEDEPEKDQNGSEEDRSNESDTGVIGEKNQRPPIAQIDDDEVDSGKVNEAETNIQESKATGPDTDDAVPENSKEGGPEELPADNVELVDTDEDEVNEGSLQSDEEEENVASDEPDTDEQ